MQIIISCTYHIYTHTQITNFAQSTFGNDQLLLFGGGSFVALKVEESPAKNDGPSSRSLDSGTW